MAVGLEKGLQVVLGAARLGENQRLARGARRGHLFEADVQSGEQGLCLCVGTNAARPGGEPSQDVDLLTQLLPVDGARRARSLGFVRLREDLVEQVVVDLLRLDEALGELRVVLHLLVAQRFETRTQRVQRGSDGLRRRRQQFAQDERGQVTLALGKRVAVFALQEPGHRLVERVLVVARRERLRDRPPLGVADVLGDLIAQRALAEAREALTQIADAAAGAGVLAAEGVEVPEQVLVDEGREAIQFEQ